MQSPQKVKLISILKKNWLLGARQAILSVELANNIRRTRTPALSQDNPSKSQTETSTKGGIIKHELKVDLMIKSTILILKIKGHEFHKRMGENAPSWSKQQPKPIQSG